MITTLISPYFQFTLDSEKATWSLNGCHPDSPAIENAWMQLRYRMGAAALLRTGSRKIQILEKWHQPKISPITECESIHGTLRQLEVELGPDINGIHVRLIFALANEGFRILEEGIAQRPGDIDIVYLYGYGFPAWRGGPMHYAEAVGLDKVLARIVEFRDRFGEDNWTPAPLLEKLVADGRSLADWSERR